ncbi:G8 domain-containing protein [Planctomyces sp. SH-PL62]|uniref:G8 domain-containing protein n=1 Tax=Planctomyces sp. SH-PL62 TaxID=1636152 RepID=UPI00078E4C86|nr:G8 domain-containing protein [Planctomyces sp. SH-PL62]AMV40880.1 G8 domain protein [Planctomyces sp. SH-PL62]
MLRDLTRRGLAALAVVCWAGSSGFAAEPLLVRSARSGAWSAKETWEQGRTPGAGDRVVVRAGHHVDYDVVSEEVVRLVQIAGTLEFARDRDTRLEAGLITITTSEEPSEDGFDCHAAMKDMGAMQDASRPALLVGRPGAPVGAGFSALIRLHYIEGMDRLSCPAIVCCGGRMEFHGQPMPHTWLKIRQTADAGASTLHVDEWAGGWKQGDHVIVTGTRRQRDGRGVGGDFLAGAQTEERRIVGVSPRDFSGGYPVKLDRPLAFSHFAEGNFRAEVANLTRNVVVESAEPAGVRGHTMYHRKSAGSISYAEFRHLGKLHEKGRYSIHFHLAGETMRGSSVIGASIWDSHNRWITIHGTDALVVRDVVGYKSVGHGFFLESGSEVNNILDHNLAALVLPGKTQNEQEVPFDPNRGAGFWWANSQNSFTRNVAAECAEYGYRFDVKKTEDYNPVRQIRQPDGTLAPKDVRILPFVRFEDNEAHTMKFFCLNLRGVTRPDRGLDFYSQNESLSREAVEARPEPGRPFWIRNFRGWEANWATHLGTTGVFIDGLDVFRSDVAVWRSIMDGSGFRRMTTKDMRVNDIHNPMSSGYAPTREESERGAFRGLSSFKDDMPPTTVITSAVREGNLVRVRGSVADSSDIKRVLVNGREATSTRGSFAEWEAVLEAPSGAALEVSAGAEDVQGHVEPRPHVVDVEPAGL